MRSPTLLQEASDYAHSKIWVVHRLDREASGLVVFAKDAETHRALCLAFETRKVGKAYLALVGGRLKGSQGKSASLCAPSAPDG